ncbi:hypothetical protein ACCC98_28650, partial [Rhizobium pisi]|uniref:hypothetical protein n=1 Tax=Rhizobium pisi TaxID=574561 RepID=UPI0039B035DB
NPRPRPQSSSAALVFILNNGRRYRSRRPFVFLPSRKTVREDEDGTTETSRQGDLSRHTQSTSMQSAAQPTTFASTIG